MCSQHQPLIKDPQTSPSRKTLINSYQKSMKPSRETLKKFGKPSKSLIIQKKIVRPKGLTILSSFKITILLLKSLEVLDPADFQRTLLVYYIL